MNKKKLYKIPVKILLQAQEKLDEVMELIGPYLITLTPVERQVLARIGAESKEFLKLSHEYAVEYPELFPDFMKESIFREIYVITRKLWAFSNKVDQLRDIISDTEMLAGNHALELALDYYRTVKIAVRQDLPGARGIYEELKPKVPPRGQRMRKVS